MVVPSSEFAGLESLCHLVLRHFAVIIGVSHFDALPALGSNFCLGQKAVAILVGSLEAVSVVSLVSTFEGLLHLFFGHFVVVVDVGYLDVLPMLRSHFCLGQKAIAILVGFLEVAFSGAAVLAATREGRGGDSERETEGGGSDDTNRLGGHGLNLPSLVAGLGSLNHRGAFGLLQRAGQLETSTAARQLALSYQYLQHDGCAALGPCQDALQISQLDPCDFRSRHMGKPRPIKPLDRPRCSG
jgi:hypothetical protein